MSQINPKIKNGQVTCNRLDCPSHISHRDTCKWTRTFVTYEPPCWPWYRARVAELEAVVERLRAWKESATEVESEWDAQKIATMLGGQLGDSCRRVVAEKVPQLLAEVKRLTAENVYLKTKNDAARESK